MKYLKLFENFDQSEIDEICEYYGIKNYTINPDNTIDVDGNVNLYGRYLTKLPLKFNKVSGFFDCSGNNLTNLIGCPNYVGDFFNCANNQLTSLIGCPTEIWQGFDFGFNKLTNLEGVAKIINKHTWYSDNPITPIIDLFGYDVKKYLEYQETYNFLRKDRKIVKHLLDEALKDYNEYYNKNRKLPEEIEGYTYI
jgi:hypothetical protein